MGKGGEYPCLHFYIVQGNARDLKNMCANMVKKRLQRKTAVVLSAGCPRSVKVSTESLQDEKSKSPLLGEWGLVTNNRCI